VGGQQQLRLAADTGVERVHGDVRALGHLGHRRRGISLAREEVPGSDEHGAPGGGRLLAPGRRPIAAALDGLGHAL
jgi:hypothetical protein